jgi:hypothetical protein
MLRTMTDLVEFVKCAADATDAIPTELLYVVM